MTVPLRQAENSEAALIVFTLLVPASVGVTLFALLFGSGLPVAAAALLLASIGMAGSITHLAKPLRAPTSLRNLRSSWLSREIAAVIVYWMFVAIWLASEGAMIAAKAGALEPAMSATLATAMPAVSLAARALAAVGGAVLLAVIERAYRVPTRPAWCGHECLMELAATALGAGATIYAAIVGWTGWAAVRVDGPWFASNAAPIVAELAACALAALIGLILDILSHKRRYKRLESLREQSDERIPLTLAHYGELQRKVRLAWSVETAAVLIAVGTTMLVAGAAAVALLCLAAVLQLIAHALQRWIFYELPVQVRWVQRLRK